MSSAPTPESDATVFINRSDAGEQLAQAVLHEIEQHPVSRPNFSAPNFIVYALPRGGLAVAAPIAQRLNCFLDVIVAKKITRPENTELAIGAVTSDGHVLWLPQSRSFHDSTQVYETALHQARERAQAQWQQFAPSRPPTDPQGAIAIVVDDGIATGMTMAVAIQALRSRQHAQIWICVPVAPPEILPHLRSWANRLIILATPTPFYSVSRFYQQFNQVEMEEAIACLEAVNGVRHEE